MIIIIKITIIIIKAEDSRVAWPGWGLYPWIAAFLEIVFWQKHLWFWHLITTNLLWVKISLINSLKNGVNEARTDNCEGLSPGRCPAGKSLGFFVIKILLERDGQKRKTKLL